MKDTLAKEGSVGEEVEDFVLVREVLDNVVKEEVGLLAKEGKS